MTKGFKETRTYTIERDDEQWVPFFKWFWREIDDQDMPVGATLENPLGRHGSYPARWIAKLSAWRHTRGREI